VRPFDAPVDGKFLARIKVHSSRFTAWVGLFLIIEQVSQYEKNDLKTPRK